MRRLTTVRPLGLRARLTLSFALGALLLSAVLSLITWNLTRENLLQQREDSALTRVFANALTLRRSLGGTPDVATLLGSLPTPEGAQLALLYGGNWDARNPVEFSQDDIPPQLLDLVGSGQAGKMRATIGQNTYLVVGVPLPIRGGQYYEAVALTDIQQTLDGLRVSLLGASAITTLAGGLFGFLASRRVLVPLRNVGQAAEAIAGGQLDTRLTSGEDRDLDPLVASFNDMAAALEERIERDTRFASEVSHELRSPLMTLAASVEVLGNSRDDLNERAQTALDLMHDDVDRFRQLVEDLLEISRVDVGAVTLHLAPVPVTELVIQAVSTSSFGTVPVRYDPEVADTIVMVDKVRFSRAVENLLANAANYAEGATSVDISLQAPPEETPMVHIAVQDTGPGVPIEEREVIFDRFSRGREGGNRGSDSGTGLGLALVDEHIRLHEGRVWVDDRPDGQPGARFVIELPVLPDVEDGEGTYHDDDYGLDVVRPDETDLAIETDADLTPDTGPDAASDTVPAGTSDEADTMVDGQQSPGPLASKQEAP